MIRVEELRIGNLLVDREVRLCRVERLDVEYEQIYAPAIKGAITILPNKPIVITEEILLKCKLLFDTESPYSKENFAVFASENEDNIFYCYWDGKKLTYHGMVIKYLHQLQNLYFALTGKELKINL